MKNRGQRAKIAKETVEILDAGYYKSQTDKLIHLGEPLNYAKANSIHYKPEMFDEVFALRDRIKQIDKQSTEFEIVNETTLSAARRLIQKLGLENVSCLNFASAKNPGGGFLKGSQSQEESLARATGLYPCIAQMREMYLANKRYRSCLYTDNMIYSPEVAVFRDDNDDLLETPYSVSIITAPAVNAGIVRRNEKRNIPQIESVMINRIEKILSLAVIHNHNTVILGAWGCGVFRNNPFDVARYFGKHLIKPGIFSSVFEKVVFAVLDNSRCKTIIQPFQEIFYK
jgi:uncharacterized protein (TIGR02452 family)